MSILEWTPEYSVRIAAIDHEHRIWFGTVADLHNAMREGKGKQSLGALLAEMVRYTLVHFAHEEELMLTAGYPGHHSHRQQHEGLRKKITAFAQRYERGETAITIELTIFLSEWIRQHTMASDRRFGDYVARSKVVAGEDSVKSGWARASR